MSTATVWERLAPPEHRGGDAHAGDAAQVATETQDEDIASSSDVNTTRAHFRRRVRQLDIIAAIVWVYGLTTFLVDLDRLALRAISPDYEWLLNVRFIVYAVAISWFVKWSRKMFLIWATYVALWPAMIVLWRLPWRFMRDGKWNHLVGLVHVLTAAVTSLGDALRGIVIAGTTILALVLPGSWTAWIALVLAAVLEAWLLRGAVRATLRPSRFLSWQRRTVAGVKSTVLVQDEQATALRSWVADSRTLTRPETEQFLQLASNALLVNRATYFWAFRLNEYRKSPAMLLYNALSMFALFIGSLVTFTVANIALFQASSSHFDVNGSPSVVKFTYYTLTSIYAGETDLVAPESDVALVVKMIATIVSGFLLLSLFVSIFLSYRYSKDDAEARRTVREMREAARRLEDDFASEFEVTPEDALERLRALKHNAVSMALYLSDAVPDDFGKQQAN